MVNFHRTIKNLNSERISRTALKAQGNVLCRQWFDIVKPLLEQLHFSSEDISPFSQQFEGLLVIARRPIASKKSYLRLLDNIIPEYRRKIIHQIEIGSFVDGSILNIALYIEGLPVDEGAYLEEAQRCLSVHGIRACIVLGWCATVARIHEKIAQIGFEKFNKASEEMAAKQFGRFKPFNKKFRVESTSELRRTVFDTDLLWILEYLSLIDSNQHERLRYCFEMRNNSAHPGQAPVTGENLYSFYSDITRIVLKNNNFTLQSGDGS